MHGVRLGDFQLFEAVSVGSGREKCILYCIVLYCRDCESNITKEDREWCHRTSQVVERIGCMM